MVPMHQMNNYYKLISGETLKLAVVNEVTDLLALRLATSTRRDGIRVCSARNV